MSLILGCVTLYYGLGKYFHLIPFKIDFYKNGLFTITVMELNKQSDRFWVEVMKSWYWRLFIFILQNGKIYFGIFNRCIYQNLIPKEGK
jgi:hypothetical protein